MVLIAEKDEWATRQTLQALLLCLVPNIIGIFFRAFDFIGWFSWSRLYIISTVWSRITSVINWGVDIFVYVFAFLAILNVSKGKEAGIPLISNFANWAYGKVVVKPQPVYQQPVAPAQQAAAQPVSPVQQTAAPAADVCANCGAPLNGGAFCTKCGTPAAK